MKLPPFDDRWPDSWKYSYPYDQIEVGLERQRDLGYANAYENRKRHAIQLLTGFVPSGGRILDVAAAQGNFTLTLAELGYSVTWNDLREDLVEYVRLKHESGTVEYKAGNVFELGELEPFDGVLITEIIEHVAHPDQFLAKIAHLVKPGGCIVMTTPNGAYLTNTLPRFSDFEKPEVFESVQFQPNSDGHIFLLWPDEVRSLAEKAGLKVDVVQLFTTPLSHGHLKMGRLLPLLPGSFVRAFDFAASLLPHVVSNRIHAHTAARYIRT